MTFLDDRPLYENTMRVSPAEDDATSDPLSSVRGVANAVALSCLGMAVGVGFLALLAALWGPWAPFVAGGVLLAIVLIAAVV